MTWLVQANSPLSRTLSRSHTHARLRLWFPPCLYVTVFTLPQSYLVDDVFAFISTILRVSIDWESVGKMFKILGHFKTYFWWWGTTSVSIILLDCHFWPWLGKLCRCLYLLVMHCPLLVKFLKLNLLIVMIQWCVQCFVCRAPLKGKRMFKGFELGIENITAIKLHALLISADCCLLL